MSPAQEQKQKQQEEVRAMSAQMLAGGSIGEAIGGAAAVVLAVVGLAHILPGVLVSIAAIAIGIALLFRGGAIAARYSKLMSGGGETLETTEYGGGLSAEFVAGATGAILGILALLGVAAGVLVPIAALVYGGALVLGSGVSARLRSLTMSWSGAPEAAQEVARQAISVAAGVQVLAGLNAVVLGIIALVGVGAPAVPITLSSVAFLGLGGSILLSGTAITAKILAIFQL